MTEAIRQGDIPGVQIRVRRELPVPPETAWRWLSRPPELARWLASRVEPLDGAAGVRSRGEDEGGAPLVERWAVRRDEAPRRRVIAFEREDAGWPVATRLTLELTPRPRGCELSLLHEGFEHLPLSDCLTIWEMYRRRWRRATARLAERLEAEAPADA